MALSDPQSITINAVANSLPRVSTENGSSTYSKDDGTISLLVSQQPGRAVSRRRAGVRSTKFTSDPFTPAVNQKVTFGVDLVVNVPVAGFTLTEQKQIVDGFLAWCTASSGANITKLLGGES